MTSLYIAIALLNGLLISTSRVINGQLATKINPLKASFFNHVIGFLILSIIITLFGQWSNLHAFPVSFSSLAGGFFGALFVSISSYVFPRLGALKTAILIIAGQLISALILDWLIHYITPSLLQYLGVVVILIGVFLSKKSSSHHNNKR